MSARTGDDRRLYGRLLQCGLGAAALALVSLAAPAAANGFAGSRYVLPAPATAHPLASPVASALKSARSIYVTPQGNDQAAGTRRQPLKTLRRALATAQPGATIYLATSYYKPFVVETPNLTIEAADGAHPVIEGNASFHNVIRLSADNDTLDGLDVANCVPNPNPGGAFEENGSSGVKIDVGTRGDRVQNLQIHGRYLQTSEGLRIGCYGIAVMDATRALVRDNDIYHNGYGVFVYGGGQNVEITGNKIHSNHALIRNTVHPDDDDFGADAIGFTNSTGSSATHNQIWDNYGPSHDWGTDGGGFEIFNASRTSMVDNTLHRNNDVLETGAGQGGACVDNTFSDNTAVGAVKPLSFPAVGLILRCADQMTVAHNHLRDFDWWTFWIYQPSGDSTWGGLTRDVTIHDNLITQGYPMVFSFTSSLAGMELDVHSNQYSYKGVFATDSQGQTFGFKSWHSKTDFS